MTCIDAALAAAVAATGSAVLVDAGASGAATFPTGARASEGFGDAPAAAGGRLSSVFGPAAAAVASAGFASAGFASAGFASAGLGWGCSALAGVGALAFLSSATFHLGTRICLQRSPCRRPLTKRPLLAKAR